jgi:hypothetical protein
MSTRPCTHCGSAGPFYLPRRPRDTWCIACHTAHAQVTYARTRAVRLARLQAKAAAGLLLSRAEERFVLRATCPPGHKFCAYGHHTRPRGCFAPRTHSRDGRDWYCRQCRTEMQHYYAAQRRQKDHRHAA